MSAQQDRIATNLEELNKQIYKHSIELAVVNKTLSLLRKLYQVSLQALEPAVISERISGIIRLDLNMELVGVFLYDPQTDSMKPYKFSVSERLQKSQEQQKASLDSYTIETASKNNPLFSELLVHKQVVITKDLTQLWGNLLNNPGLLKQIVTDSHIQTLIVDPLLIDGQVIGAIALGLNRDYEILSDFEKEAIKSFIDVVAVALDKALLYAQLKDANEQLKALDKARAEFISIASHQLRTPPATIKWYLGAVLSGDFGPLSDDLKSALERTNVTNEAQISTIDDLLNASRIERGKLEFFFEKANMEPIVSALVMQLQPLAEMKKQHIVYEKPKTPVPDVMMDHEKIRQVINNMIDNAIKYSKTGDIRVVLEADTENVTVKIIDTGKGIAPEDAPKLFQKYQRGSDSATHATGLGLGMYVAKIVVEQNQGKIWAESEGLGKGSTFAFSLPIKSDLKPTTIDLAAEEHK
jgi:signal transduction histidine kinase